MGSREPGERLLAVLVVAMMLGAALPVALAVAWDDEGPRPAGWSGSGAGHMWPMFGKDASHTGAADDYDRGIVNPGVKWERTGTIQSLATVIGNFTGNVLATNSSHSWDEELHCAVYSTTNQVHVVEGSGGQDVWLLNITGTFAAAPALGDVDGDGRTDILLATRTGVLYSYEPVIRWNGTRFTWWGNNTLREQLWNTTTAPLGTVTASSLVLDDLNGNGTDELLVGSSRGIFCMNARFGNELWNRSVSGVPISTPAVYRVGAQRNVVATSFNTTPSPDQLRVYTLRGTTGALIKSLSMELTVTAGTFLPAIPFFPAPLSADLDRQGDGDELIIVQPYEGSTGRIIAFSDGDLDWGSQAYNRSLGGSGDLDQICHATPAVADLEGDGVLDVVVASWKTYQAPLGNRIYTNVSVYKGPSGTRGWGTDIDVTTGIDFEWAISSPVLMDADEDDVLDVLLVQYNGRMTALSGKNGTVLWALATRGYPAALVTSSPAVGDLDLDTFPEVVFNGIAVSFLLPDLEVDAGDITLTDPTPEEGDTVGIDVLVHNIGNYDARDVLVSLLDNGELAGNATIGSIVAGSSYSARINHQFYGRVEHTLTAVVDPLGDIEELRKDNNRAERDVTIISRYGLVIDCPSNETILSPGTTWHYFAEVINLGQYANRIRVTSSTAPTGWTVTITPSNFLLGPAGGPSDSITVDMEVKTDRSTEAGKHPITVTATSQNESRNFDRVTLTTVVRGQYGVFLSPGEARANVVSEYSVVYRFNATNIGNSVDSFTVEAVIPDPDPRWGVNIFPAQINALSPEGVTTISMSVSAPAEATEGETYTVFLNVASISDPARYDEARTVTTVVVPDIAVLGVEYRRADGTAVDGTSKRLVAGEASVLVGRLANLRGNADISSVRVRFNIDGIPNDVTVLDLPAKGVTEVVLEHIFTSPGTHTVQVIADPYEVISDGDRSNNVASGTVGVKSRTPVGSFEVAGRVLQSDGITPVPGATVRVTVQVSGYSFTVSTDGLGTFNASLANTKYQDGDLVEVNTTDGRDFAEEAFLAYSEDQGIDLELVLSEGVHHDVALVTDAVLVDVMTGESREVNVTLVSTGTRDTTVDLTVQAPGWSPRLRFANGTEARAVHLPVGGQEHLVLAFGVPDDARGGASMVFQVLAVPREDPEGAGRLNVTANVTVVRGFTISVVDTPPAAAHPGESRMHNISVRSTGNVDDTVDLAFDRNFLAWEVAFDLDPVPLMAFGQVLVRVTLVVPEYITPGEYTIAVTGVSAADEGVVANAYVIETVEELRHGVSITPSQAKVTGKPGETVWWQLQVRNLGNVKDSYSLTAFGLPQGYGNRFKVVDSAVSQVTLAPGGSVSVSFEVDVPDTFTDSPDTLLQLTVKASSLSSSTAFNNTQLQLELRGVLDLTLDVTTSTDSPKLGKKVIFTVVVKNLGPDDGAGIMLYAHFGEDTEKKSVGAVASKAEKELVVEWYPLEAGPVQVTIIVNPPEEEGAIWEITYDNNDWVRPMRVAADEENPLWESGWFWILIIVVVVIAILAIAMLGGRGGPVEVAEVVEEDEEDEDAGADEDEGSEEEGDEEDLLEDGEDVEEGADDDWDDDIEEEEEEVQVRPRRKVAREEPSGEPEVPFTVGRM